MLRNTLSVLCLFATAGFVAAAEKKDEGSAVTGKFKSYANGKLTIMAGKSGQEKERTFDVLGDTKVNEDVVGVKKSFLAKNTFSELTRDADVTVHLDNQGKVSNIFVDRNNVITGRFKDYSGNKLTVMAGKPGHEKEMTFNVLPETKVDEIRDGAKKSFLAKNTFKEIDHNAEVTVTLDKDRNITSIMVNRRAK